MSPTTPAPSYFAVAPSLLSVSLLNWPLPLSFTDNHGHCLTAGDRISEKIDGRGAP